jgi:polyhydroxyalkanoate synthesis regulator phasin
MKKNENKFTLAEMADALVFKNRLTPEERKSADEELIEARRKNSEGITENQQLHAKGLQLRFLKEDNV